MWPALFTPRAVALIGSVGEGKLGYHLLRFWQERIPALTLSRSRPYHKNDNRFVEQRNGFLIPIAFV